MDANSKYMFTTLEGLKRRATELKRETGCKHNEALEFIAKLGGYTNYQHAFRALAGR
ncbi:hypothetical protein QE363_000778 [Sphingomonas sp. SORGH_AS870]|uniref:hypothetical protein n=1 Tax=Sphingomonas sp. SORGH_AS_0870 TaxID=3041801 RepID=UPI0028648930|nr:hypothetical protein [Sphingomonas sp. SORGH_AS_0870]MDR6144985.1 hypothetical protein [Sphingomonas sp. SORGH_AS_0870]